MVKGVYYYGILIIFLFFFLSGCIENSSNNKNFNSISVSSCEYLTDENKIFLSIDMVNPKHVECIILNDVGSIGSSYINEIENATYIELDESINYGEIYGLIIKSQYSDTILFSIGLNFNHNGQADFVEWELPGSSTFKLVSWEQTFDESAFYLGVLVKFEFSKDCGFHIIDSDGIEIASKYVDFTESETTIHFKESAFAPSLFNQSLNLVVTEGYFSDNDIIYQEKIRLDGNISLSIIDANFEWNEEKLWSWDEEEVYKLSEFDFTVLNTGDIPLYSGDYSMGSGRLPNIGDELKIIFEEEEDIIPICSTCLRIFKISPFGVVKPNKESTSNFYFDRYSPSIYVESPGIYEITLVLEVEGKEISFTKNTSIG